MGDEAGRVSLDDYHHLVQAYRERDARPAEAVTRSLMTGALAAIETHWDLLDAQP